MVGIIDLKGLKIYGKYLPLSISLVVDDRFCFYAEFREFDKHRWEIECNPSLRSEITFSLKYLDVLFKDNDSTFYANIKPTPDLRDVYSIGLKGFKKIVLFELYNWIERLNKEYDNIIFNINNENIEIWKELIEGHSNIFEDIIEMNETNLNYDSDKIKVLIDMILK